MTAYYNEIEPYCVAWLRNLIAAGILPPGDVDDRSIAEVQPDDIRGYTQCHWFAGLGGWAYSLRLAGWPDDRPVWTGSCPCQPFSVAGKRGGFDDPRHLWPQWQRLIAECRPPDLLAEQIAGAPEWLALVHRDLEALDYAVGCVPIEAASAGADHFRDRYWIVANGQFGRRESHHQHGHAGPSDGVQASQGSGPGTLAHGHGHGHGHGQRSQVPFGQSSDLGPERPAAARDGVRDVADSQGVRRQKRNGEPQHGWPDVGERTPIQPERLGGGGQHVGHPPSLGWGEGWTESELRRWGPAAAVSSIGGCQIIECPDGKWRRLPPPRVRWLGVRLPARIPRVRALGNSIDTRAAVAFIEAVMECQP